MFVQRTISRRAWLFACVLGIAGCDKKEPSPTQRDLEKAHSKAEVEDQDEKATSKGLVKLTHAAAAEIARMLPNENTVLRIAVEPAANGGYFYSMKFEDRGESTHDISCTATGVPIVVDRGSAELVSGTTIDWQSAGEGRKSGFVFDNPRTPHLAP